MRAGVKERRATHSSDDSNRFAPGVAEELIRVINRDGLADYFIRPARIVVKNSNHSS